MKTKKEKEDILKRMDEISFELIELNDRRDFIFKAEQNALSINDHDLFESFSIEFVLLCKRIMNLCSYLSVLSDRYTYLVSLEEKPKKNDSLKKNTCSTLGEYLDSLSKNDVVSIPYICSGEFKVKNFIKSENYKIYKDYFVKKVSLVPECGILIAIDNVV